MKEVIVMLDQRFDQAFWRSEAKCCKQIEQKLQWSECLKGSKKVVWSKMKIKLERKAGPGACALYWKLQEAIGGLWADGWMMCSDLHQVESQLAAGGRTVRVDGMGCMRGAGRPPRRLLQWSGKEWSQVLKMTNFLPALCYFGRITTQVGDLIMLASIDSAGELGIV